MTSGSLAQRALLVGVAALALVLAASPEPARAADAQITIDNFTFSPAQLTVSPGTRVTWTNRDDIPHTIVDRDEPRAMKSPPLDTGESFSFVFNRAGEFHYFCSIHPHMQGIVVVR